MQKSLFCPLIELIDEGTLVVAPQDLVYSTQPRRATGLDGHSYFVKGPDRNIVVAEAVAHQLAGELGLRIPEFGIALDEHGPRFASKEVERCHRQVETWIKRGKVVNPEVLSQIIAFDIWMMNKDRNIGNLVGEAQVASSEGKIAVVAIDFEKSMTLRGPYPLTTTPEIHPNALWPSGTLGQLVTGIPRPEPFISALESITQGHVLDAFAQVEARLGESVQWKENSAQLLERRAKAIRKHIGEVWR